MIKETFFHEDDYRQIEILPISTMDFCLAQMEKIQSFSNQHRCQDGEGWSDMFVRSEAPANPASLNIKKEDMAVALKSIMTEYEKVYTGYSSHRELCLNTMAYGDEQTGRIFFNYDENEMVTSIWCSDLVSEICKLPQKNKLLVADWCWGFSCPLSDIEKIEKFISFKSEKIREHFEKINASKNVAQNKPKWWETLLRYLGLKQ